MIVLTKSNLLTSEADALVNTVNCVGIMGKGVALQFKLAFPRNFDVYKTACDTGAVVPGKMLTFETGQLTGPKYIINFPTKRHWRDSSRLDDIRIGLDALIREVRRLNVQSVAVPPLGCGNGGLAWSAVRPLIEAAFATLPDLRVDLYPPQEQPAGDQRPVRTTKPQWTRSRAIFVRLMDLYRSSNYSITQLEVQKLAYFLQAAGEPLKLRYAKHIYGPYADNLSFVLQVMDGHFIRGAIDRKPTSQIQVIDAAVEEAKAFLANDSEAATRLADVAQLIEGFETPYGMELLATVHWVGTHEVPSVADPDAVISAVHGWSAEKKRRFEAGHITKAFEHLGRGGWLVRKVDPVAS